MSDLVRSGIVRLAVLGAEVREMPVTQDLTVRDLLERASVDVSTSIDVRVNGQVATLDDRVDAGDTMVVLPRIRGGGA